MKGKCKDCGKSVERHWRYCKHCGSYMKSVNAEVFEATGS